MTLCSNLTLIISIFQKPSRVGTLIPDNYGTQLKRFKHTLPIHKYAWGKALGSSLLHSVCLAINYYYSHRRYPACVLNFTRKNNLCTCKEGFMCKIQNQRFKCNPDSL